MVSGPGFGRIPIATDNKGFVPEDRIDIAFEKEGVIKVMRVDKNNQVMDEFRFTLRQVEQGKVIPYSIIAEKDDFDAAAAAGLDNVYDLFHFTPVAISVDGRMFWLRWPHLQMLLTYVREVAAKERFAGARETADRPEKGSVILTEDGGDTTK